MPLVQSISPVLSRTILEGMMGAVLTRPAAALVDAFNVGLWTAGPTPPTPTSEYADFTAATFTGYVAVPVVPTEWVALPSGDGIGMTGDALFILGSGAGQTILGYFAYDNGSNLIMSEVFETPIPLANPGDFISLQLFFPLAYSVDIE